VTGPEFISLGDMFAEVEAKAVAEAKVEKDREDTAFAALSPEEQERVRAAQIARYEAMFPDMPEDTDLDEADDRDDEDEEEDGE